MASAFALFRSVVVVAVAASVAACTSNYFVRPNAVEPPPVVSSVPPPADGSYVVQRGDTIYVVARRFGLSVRSLIDANQLQPPFQLNPGQVLRMPAGGDYVVVKGDSLAKVSRKIGVEFATLARINGLKPPYILHVGQRLTMPSGVNVQTASAGGGDVIESPALSGSGGGAQPTMPVPTPLESTRVEATPLAAPEQKPIATALAAPPQQAQPIAPPIAMRDRAAPPPAGPAIAPLPAPPSSRAASPPAPLAATPAPPPPSAEPVVAVAPPPPSPPAGSGFDFIWPVHGPVLVPFGTIAKGQRNDGVNIAVPKGTPVLAAGDGEVAYAGNELSGFGNMLLIKHTGTDYVTVYAHNEKLLVRRGDRVRRGQKIALSGETGGVPQPQLLFELRKGVRPIDPQTVLPNELSPAAAQGGQPDPG